MHGQKKRWKASSMSMMLYAQTLWKEELYRDPSVQLMFKTFQGVTEDAKNTVYLRPETALGNFCKLQECSENIKKEDPIWNRTDR